jgi:hypothetical protein
VVTPASTSSSKPEPAHPSRRSARLTIRPPAASGSRRRGVLRHAVGHGSSPISSCPPWTSLSFSSGDHVREFADGEDGTRANVRRSRRAASPVTIVSACSVTAASRTRLSGSSASTANWTMAQPVRRSRRAGRGCGPVRGGRSELGMAEHAVGLVSQRRADDQCELPVEDGAHDEAGCPVPSRT